MTESYYSRRTLPQEQVSHYQRYRSNRASLVNMGIESMLADNSNNDELQQYLNEKAYDTASLGETSADELLMI